MRPCAVSVLIAVARWSCLVRCQVCGSERLAHLFVTVSLGLGVCWDLTTGATVEHKCHNREVTAMCIVGDHVVTASFGDDSVHLWSLPSCLSCDFVFRYQCDLIVVVEQVSQCVVKFPRVAASYGTSVFFGCEKGVTEWNTTTEVVSKLLEKIDLRES